MKAGFIKRLLAYFVDSILVSLLVTILALGIKNNANTYEQELSNLIKDYMAGDVQMGEYLNQVEDLNYEISKASAVTNTISVVLTIGYFIVFAYLNKGQTIGKKIFKIKVVENGDAPSLKAMILRNIIILQIVSNLCSVILINILNKNMYFLVTETVTAIEELIIIVSVFMILYRSDKRGVHDLIAHTEVIEEVQ